MNIKLGISSVAGVLSIQHGIRRFKNKKNDEDKRSWLDCLTDKTISGVSSVVRYISNIDSDDCEDEKKGRKR